MAQQPIDNLKILKNAASQVTSMLDKSDKFVDVSEKLRKAAEEVDKAGESRIHSTAASIFSIPGRMQKAWLHQIDPENQSILSRFFFRPLRSAILEPTAAIATLVNIPAYALSGNAIDSEALNNTYIRKAVKSYIADPIKNGWNATKAQDNLIGKITKVLDTGITIYHKFVNSAFAGKAVTIAAAGALTGGIGAAVGVTAVVVKTGLEANNLRKTKNLGDELNHLRSMQQSRLMNATTLASNPQIFEILEEQKIRLNYDLSAQSIVAHATAEAAKTIVDSSEYRNVNKLIEKGQASGSKYKKAEKILFDKFHQYKSAYENILRTEAGQTNPTKSILTRARDDAKRIETSKASLDRLMHENPEFEQVFYGREKGAAEKGISAAISSFPTVLVENSASLLTATNPAGAALLVANVAVSTFGSAMGNMSEEEAKIAMKKEIQELGRDLGVNYQNSRDENIRKYDLGERAKNDLAESLALAQLSQKYHNQELKKPSESTKTQILRDFVVAKQEQLVILGQENELFSDDKTKAPVTMVEKTIRIATEGMSNMAAVCYLQDAPLKCAGYVAQSQEIAADQVGMFDNIYKQEKQEKIGEKLEASARVHKTKMQEELLTKSAERNAVKPIVVTPETFLQKAPESEETKKAPKHKVTIRSATHKAAKMVRHFTGLSKFFGESHVNHHHTAVIVPTASSKDGISR